MVGGDRRSPPRHKAKGGGGKGKGGGGNEGFGAIFDGSVQSVGAKLTARHGEKFHFGSFPIEESLQQVKGNCDGPQGDMLRDGTSSDIVQHDSSRVTSIDSMEVSDIQIGTSPTALKPISCGNTSWALEVEAYDALQSELANSNGAVTSVSAMDHSSLSCMEELQRQSRSSPSVRTKLSEEGTSELLLGANNNAIFQTPTVHTAGMDCDGVSPTTNGISHNAVNDVDCVNHNGGAWNSEKSGKSANADDIGMHSTLTCTQDVCSSASTGQCAVNTYVKTGFIVEGKSATSSSFPIAAVKPMVQDSKLRALGVNDFDVSRAASNTANTYVKTGLMGDGISALCEIATSNGLETTIKLQHNQVNKHWNSPIVLSRAEYATEVSNVGLKSKATAVSPLSNVHPPNAWKRPSHLKVNTMELGTITTNGRSVSFDDAAYERNKRRLENGLVGKLFGRKLPLHILDQELSRRWSHVGGFRTILIGGDCFLCVFETQEARDSILMGGPWQVMGQLIGMEKWSPEFNPELLTGFSSPVWVRFPKLPLLYWDNITIARIASMIGEPLWIDAQTTEWGRCEYARVCIRIDLSRSLPTGIWIQGKQAEFFQAVEYEGISLLCFHCGVIGHKAEICRSKSMVTSTRNATSTKTTNVVVNGEAMEGSNPSSALGECTSANRPKVQRTPDTHDNAIFVDQEDVKKYGPWILVSRKRKPQSKNGKKFTPTMISKPAIPQTTHQAEFTLERQQEKVPEIDEQLESNVDDSAALLPTQQMDVAGVELVKTTDASLTSSSRKGKSRISKAHFEKELLQLGPIALKSRKRKKKVTFAEAEQCLKDFTQASNSGGGDASPSRGK